MADNNLSKAKALHSRLTKKGFNVGSFEEFQKDMADEESRKYLHSNLTKQGWNLGSYDTFSGIVAPSPVSVDTTAQVAPTDQAEAPINVAGVAAGSVQTGMHTGVQNAVSAPKIPEKKEEEIPVENADENAEPDVAETEPVKAEQQSEESSQTGSEAPDETENTWNDDSMPNSMKWHRNMKNVESPEKLKVSRAAKLVRIGMLTKEGFKEITGLDYDSKQKWEEVAYVSEERNAGVQIEDIINGSSSKESIEQRAAKIHAKADFNSATGQEIKDNIKNNVSADMKKDGIVDAFDNALSENWNKNGGATFEKAQEIARNPFANISSTGTGISGRQPYMTSWEKEEIKDPIGAAHKVIDTVGQEKLMGYAMKALGLSYGDIYDAKESGAPENDGLNENQRAYKEQIVNMTSKAIVDEMYNELYEKYKSENKLSGPEWMAMQAVRGSMTTSLIGTIMDWCGAALDSKIRGGLTDQQFNSYEASAGEKGLAAAESLMLDSWMFAVGGIGSKALGERAAGRMAQLLTSSKVSSDIAIRAASMNPVTKFITGLTARAVQSGASFGGFEATGELINQLGEGRLSLYDLFSAYAGGAGTGATLGIIGGIPAELTAKFGKGTRILGDAIGLSGEHAYFTLSEAMEYAKQNNCTLSDVPIGSIAIKQAAMLGLLKAQHFSDYIERYNSDFTKQLDLNLSRRDKFIISKILGQKYTPGDTNKSFFEKLLDGEIEYSDGEVKDNIDLALCRLMYDESLPAAVKMKLNYLFTGKLSPIGVTFDKDGNLVGSFDPLDVSSELEVNDYGNSSTVTLYSENGDIVNEYLFSNKKDARKFIGEANLRIQANRIRSIRAIAKSVAGKELAQARYSAVEFAVSEGISRKRAEEFLSDPSKCKNYAEKMIFSSYYDELCELIEGSDAYTPPVMEKGDFTGSVRNSNEPKSLSDQWLESVSKLENAPINQNAKWVASRINGDGKIVLATDKDGNEVTVIGDTSLDNVVIIKEDGTKEIVKTSSLSDFEKCEPTDVYEELNKTPEQRQAEAQKEQQDKAQEARTQLQADKEQKAAQEQEDYDTADFFMDDGNGNMIPVSAEKRGDQWVATTKSGEEIPVSEDQLIDGDQVRANELKSRQEQEALRVQQEQEAIAKQQQAQADAEAKAKAEAEAKVQKEAEARRKKLESDIKAATTEEQIDRVLKEAGELPTDAAFQNLLETKRNEVKPVEEDVDPLQDKAYEIINKIGSADRDAVIKTLKSKLKIGHIRASGLLDKYLSDNKIQEEDQNTSGVVRDGNESKFDEQTLSAIDTIAKKLGVKVRFVDKVNGGIANASYNNGVILIDKNSNEPIKAVFGHEVMHSVRDSSNEAYSNFKKALIEAVGEKQFKSSVKKIVDLYKSQDKTISNELAEEEAVADFAGSLLENSKALDKFIGKADKGVIEKFIDLVRNFKEWLFESGYYGDRTGSIRGSAVYDITKESFEELENKLVQALNAVSDLNAGKGYYEKANKGETYREQYYMTRIGLDENHISLDEAKKKLSELENMSLGQFMDLDPKRFATMSEKDIAQYHKARVEAYKSYIKAYEKEEKEFAKERAKEEKAKKELAQKNTSTQAQTLRSQGMDELDIDKFGNIEKERGVTPPSPVKATKINIEDYAEQKDALRSVMMGVYHEDGMEIASDSKILIANEASYPEELEGKISVSDPTHKRFKNVGIKEGGIIEGKYPMWKMVLPTEDSLRKSTVNSDELLGVLATIKKQEGKKGFSESKIIVNLGDGKCVVLNAEKADMFLRAMKNAGATELLYKMVDGKPNQVVYKNGRNIGLIMGMGNTEYFGSDPIYSKDYSYVGTSEMEKMSIKSDDNYTPEAKKEMLDLQDAFDEGDVLGATEGVRLSLKLNDKMKEKSNKAAKKTNYKFVSKKELDDANTVIDTMVDIMRKYEDAEYEGKRILPSEVYGKGYSTIYANGSYGKTMENTLRCLRTLAYNDFVDAVKKKLGRPMTTAESFLASQMLYDISLDPQCLYCYVSLDRKAYDDFLLRYIDDRDKAMSAYRKAGIDPKERLKPQAKSKSDRKGSEYSLGDSTLEKVYKDFLGKREDSPNMRERFNMWIDAETNPDSRLIDKRDLATDDSRSETKLIDPLIKKQIEDAENYAQGASWAKKSDDYRSYAGEILKMKPETIEKLKKEYGLRFYSFSEFTGAFIAENMQMVRDAAILGLNGLGYTKELDFPRIFAPTGMNINISCYGKFAEDGKTMVMDTKQGADWAGAQELRNKYPNVGCVFVATGAKEVEWALNQPWIDVVIPFHIVRTGQNVADYYKWTNHSAMQADKDAKGHNMDIMPTEHLNDRDTFFRLCEERGLSPRFGEMDLPSGIKAKDHPNYMKLVNETRQSVGNTMPLKPVFDLDAAKTSFSDFVDKGGYYGGWWAVGEDDVRLSVETVANDVEAGKEANEVRYGRQDIPMDAEKLAAASRRQRQHGNTPRLSIKADDKHDVFYSNAERFVEDSKQEKATGDQWLKMIQNGGGLKAGEDKWIGLSSWLKEHSNDKLTKQDVLDYVNDHKIKIEEVDYSTLDMKEFGIDEDTPLRDSQKIVYEKLKEKYPEQFAADLANAFSISYNGGGLKVESWNDNLAESLYIEDTGKVLESTPSGRITNKSWMKLNDWAKEKIMSAFGLEDNKPINSTRYRFTTRGLNNKKEIALVVPNIDPYNESDEIHFGDAGDGRAVAWIRFGETTDKPSSSDVSGRNIMDELEKKYGHVDALHKMTSEDKARRYFASYIVCKGYITPDKMGEQIALEEGAEVALKFYDLVDEAENGGSKVLVIDEIQSKRHDDARKNGYADGDSSLIETKKKYEDSVKALKDYKAEMNMKYGNDSADTWPNEMSKEEHKKFLELMEYNQDCEMEYMELGNELRKKVPDAPFDKNWSELAMKRMLRYAADNGFDKIAWTTGDQQQKRYGVDVPKFLYDEVLPNYLNKYGKKYGVKVGSVILPNVEPDGREMHSIDITPEMRDYVKKGQPMFSLKSKDDEVFAKKFAKKFEGHEDMAKKAIDLDLNNKDFNSDLYRLSGMFSKAKQNAKHSPIYTDENGVRVSENPGEGGLVRFIDPKMIAGYDEDGKKLTYGDLYKAQKEQLKPLYDAWIETLDYLDSKTTYGPAKKNIADLKKWALSDLEKIERAASGNYDPVADYNGRYAPVMEQGETYKDFAQRVVDESKNRKLGFERGKDEPMIEFARRMAMDSPVLEPARSGATNEESTVRFSLASGKKKDELDKLYSRWKKNGSKNDDDMQVVYRAMILGEDGKLYPPMSDAGLNTSAKREGAIKTGNPVFGQFDQSEEHPEVIAGFNTDKKTGEKHGYTYILTENGQQTKVAYNPYLHTSRTMLNDQFGAAWRRPRLVTVKCAVPTSELSSGYKAEFAKDAVGEVEWKSGTVGRKLAEKYPERTRKVILSRWAIPIEVVDVDEYAKNVAKMLEGTDLTIPFNCVTPEQREALVRAGVKISAPEGPGKSEASDAAYKAWTDGEDPTTPNGGGRRFSLKQTKSESFKKWFGDWEKDPENSSKVVDEEGKPLVVYHGSKNKKFTVFDTENRSPRVPNARGTGAWFGSKDRAIGYTNTAEELSFNTPTEKEMIEQIKNDKDFNDEFVVEEHDGKYSFRYVDEDDLYSIENASIKEAYEKYIEEKNGGEGGYFPVYLDIKNPFVIDYNGSLFDSKKEGPNGEVFNTVNDAARWARKNGFDGMIVKNIDDNGSWTPIESWVQDEYVVFNPEQIKSAQEVTTDDTGKEIPIENRFDRTNPDIRYSIKGFHGTDKDFEKFKKEYLGKGIGVNAYGEGVYITTSRDNADDYATEVYNERGKGYISKSKSKLVEEAENWLDKYPTKEDYIEVASEEEIASMSENDKKEYDQYIEDQTKSYERVKKQFEDIVNMPRPRRLYKVDIPSEDEGAMYIDWNKKLDKRDLDTYAGFLVDEPSAIEWLEKRVEGSDELESFKQILSKCYSEGDLYEGIANILGSPKEASRFFSEIGFTGVKTEATTREGDVIPNEYNYVIFNPEDASITGKVRFSIKPSKTGRPLTMPAVDEAKTRIQEMQDEINAMMADQKWTTLPNEKEVSKAKKADDVKTLVNELDTFIRERINKQIGQHLDSKHIKSILSQIKRAANKQDLREPVRQLQMILNEAQMKHDAMIMEKLMSVETQKKNSSGILVAKNVTEPYRKAFDAIKATFGGMFEKGVDHKSRAASNETVVLTDKNNALTNIMDAIADGKTPEESDVIAYYAEAPIRENVVEVEKTMAEMDDARAAWNKANMDILDFHKDSRFRAAKGKQSLGVTLTQDDLDALREEKQLKDISWAAEDYYLQKQREVANLTHETSALLKGFLETGHDAYKAAVQADIDRKAAIIRDGIRDFKSKEVVPEGGNGIRPEYVKKAQKVWDTINATAYSLDYILSNVRNAFSKEGSLYERFFLNPETSIVAAEGEKADGINRFGKTLDDAVATIFGRKRSTGDRNKNFEWLKNDSEKEIGAVSRLLTKEDAGTFNHMKKDGRNDWEAGIDEMQMTGMTKGNALYAWLCWQQPDGKMKLMKQGYTDKTMLEIEKALGPQYLDYGRWMTDSFLPKLRTDRYNPRHIEMYGTSMSDNEHYFPLRIDKEALKPAGGLEDMQQQFMPSTISPNLIKRRTNAAKLDIVRSDVSNGTNALDVIMDYGNAMEQWYNMAPIIRDFNTLHASKTFKNIMEANRAGSFKQLMQAAQVATGSLYAGDNISEVNKFIGKTISTYAKGAIGYRLMTAAKQITSYPAFMTYAWDLEFFDDLFDNVLRNFTTGKSGSKLQSNHEWAMENLPLYRQRSRSGDMGMEGMNDKTFFDSVLRKYGEAGMWANRAVDRRTIATGARAVYNCAMRRLKKQGYSDSEAHNRAVIEAQIVYNESQQSSVNAFSSMDQKNPDSMMRGLTLFRNASIGYGRMVRSGFKDMAKAVDNRANSTTGKRFYEFAGGFARAFNFGILLPTIWNYAANTSYLADDTEDEEEKEMVFDSMMLGILTDGTTFGGMISAVNSGYDYNPMNVFTDINQMRKKIQQEGIEDPAVMEYMSKKALLYGTGFNWDTWDHIIRGTYNLYDDLTKEEKDQIPPQLAIDALMIVNMNKTDRERWAKVLYTEYGPVAYAMALEKAQGEELKSKKSKEAARVWASTRDQELYNRMEDILEFAKEFEATKREMNASQSKKAAEEYSDKLKELQKDPRFYYYDSGIEKIYDRILEQVSDDIKKKNNSNRNRYDNMFKKLGEQLKRLDETKPKG